MKMPDHDQQKQVVELEIGIEQLESLFNNGEVCATDVRCYYCSSPSCTWNLCLKACAKRKHVGLDDRELCGCCQHSIEKLDQNENVPICVKSECLEYIGKKIDL